MLKKDWQDLFDNLKRIRSEFLDSYFLSVKGKNKKIRDSNKEKVKDIIDSTIKLITNNQIYEKLLLIDIVDSEYDRAIFYDDFKSPKTFGKDLEEFLRKILIEINKT